MSVRHDWYQSDSKVVISVLLKNAKEKNYKVDIERQRVHMTAEGYELDIKLFAPINVERSSYKDFPSKVEITLAKLIGIRWDSLDEKIESKPVMAPPPPIYKKNWDSLAKEVEKSEEEEAQSEEEEAQSEEALQRLFKNLYSSFPPEIQKAMNKSYSESGGTVPEGCEFHKWE